MLPFVGVSVGIHLSLPLRCRGVFATVPQQGLPGVCVVVLGSLRARGSPAPVGWAAPLGSEWAALVRPVLWAGGL